MQKKIQTTLMYYQSIPKHDTWGPTDKTELEPKVQTLLKFHLKIQSKSTHDV